MSISRPQQEDQPHTVPPPRPSGRNISIGGLPSPPSSRDHSIKESPTLSYSSLLAESGDKDPWKTEIQGYSIPKHRHKPQRSFPTAWSIMSDKGLEGLKDRWKNDQEEDETEDHMADSSIQMNIFDPNPRGDSHPYASIASIASIANQQSHLSHDSPRFWDAKSPGSSLRDYKKGLAKPPLPTKVWADLMDTSKGRDKVLVGSFKSWIYQFPSWLARRTWSRNVKGARVYLGGMECVFTTSQLSCSKSDELGISATPIPSSIIAKHHSTSTSTDWN